MPLKVHAFPRTRPAETRMYLGRRQPYQTEKEQDQSRSFSKKDAPGADGQRYECEEVQAVGKEGVPLEDSQ